MIHQLKNIDLDIRIGACRFFKKLRESQSIKFTETTIYFNGFVSPLIIVSTNDLPEIKGIIPREPRKTFDSYARQSTFMFSSCQIKRSFEDDYIMNPLKRTLKDNMRDLLS